MQKILPQQLITTMSDLQLKKHNGTIHSVIDLASSKSDSNRALIIDAITGFKCALSRLANANDTHLMQTLLKSEGEVVNVEDAGTTMRFLTAYHAVMGNKVLMTGTHRMTERPIGILVDALRELGAEITYEQNDGYPPHRIHGFNNEGKSNHIKIRGDVSSQYISALMMVAPKLPQGIKLELTGKIGSKTYLELTVSLMRYFGAEVIWTDNIIEIPHQEYTPKSYTVEADWSGASYWYSIVALAEDAAIELKGLRNDSFQGDSVLIEMMKDLGVTSTYTGEGFKLTKTTPKERFEWDFTHCPDIAQTISVICAAKGISAKLTGLESLRIKETDRIEAIKNELGKFGVEVKVIGDEAIEIEAPKMTFNNQFIETYKDHRMAMSFAPLALLGDVRIENPTVVRKSYPDFWRDLAAVGFESKELVS